MLVAQNSTQIMWDLSRLLRIAIGDVSDKVNEVSKKYEAIVCRRGRGLGEDLQLICVLNKLAGEIILVRAMASSALIMQLSRITCGT